MCGAARWLWVVAVLAVTPAGGAPRRKGKGHASSKPSKPVRTTKTVARSTKTLYVNGKKVSTTRVDAKAAPPDRPRNRGGRPKHRTRGQHKKEEEIVVPADFFAGDSSFTSPAEAPPAALAASSGVWERPQKKKPPPRTTASGDRPQSPRNRTTTVLPGWGFAMPYGQSCFGDCDATSPLSLDVAVSQFGQPAAPLLAALARTAPARVAPLRAFVYCKRSGCAQPDLAAARATGRYALVDGVLLPNVGRSDHTYLVHALRLRGDLANVTLFVKDTTPWHKHLGSMINVLGLARAPPANLEAFCPRTFPAYETTAFELATYVSDQCRRFQRCHHDETYVRADIRPLGAWLAAYAGVRAPRNAPVAACFGGVFAAGRRALLASSQQTYEALRAQLEVGNSLEAGHYMERAWLAVLGVRATLPVARNRLAVYAAGDGRGLDRPTGRAGLPEGWDVDFIFFATASSSPLAAGTSPTSGPQRPPRGWRVVFTDLSTLALKTAPHASELGEYAYSLYVEGPPDLRAVADLVTESLADGASVALKRSAGYEGVSGHQAAGALFDAAITRDPNATAPVLHTARATIALPAGQVYDHRFVLRRHTEATRRFNDLWFLRARSMGSAWFDLALYEAAMSDVVAPVSVDVCAARASSPIVSSEAECYLERYPDLRAMFCVRAGCDLKRATRHYRTLGASEGRAFGCDAV